MPKKKALAVWPLYEGCDGKSRNLDRYGLPRTGYITATKKDYVFNPPLQFKARIKHFSPFEFPTAKEALDAAIQHRNKTLPKSLLAAITSEGVRFVRQVDVPGKSGVVLETLESGRQAWIANWEDDTGKITSMRFTVDEYGFDTALLYAIRLRLRNERRYFGHKSLLSEDEWVTLLKEVRRQFPKGPTNWSEFEFPGAISNPDVNTIQARIRIHGQSHSATFRVKDYGWRTDAKMAAVLWLIQTHRDLRPVPTRLRSTQLPPGSRSRMTGVFCMEKSDRRGNRILVWGVNTVHKGKPFPIQFCVGNIECVTPEMDSAAESAAYMCREAWEDHVREGAEFDHRYWRNWKRFVDFPLTCDGTPTDIDGVFFARSGSKYLLRIPYIWDGRERCLNLDIGKGSAATYQRASCARKVAVQFVASYRLFCANPSSPFEPREWEAWKTWSDWRKLEQNSPVKNARKAA